MSVTHDAPIAPPRPEPGPPAAIPGPARRARSGFRPDIEGMRAIAVTLVVLSHAGVAGLAGGYVGVDVFFVISGFLITTLLLGELDRTGTVSLARFYARRATRLLPASAVVLIATVTGAWLWLPATRFHEISLDGLFVTFYGINWRLAAEGVEYLNADVAPSPLQHFWSLAVEEQFYLVWPLLMLVFALIRKPRALPVTLLVITAVSLTVSVTQTDSAAPWAYFGAHTRAWELAIGALVAVTAARLTALPRALAAVLAWTGLAAVLASAVLYDDHTPFPGFAALLPVLGAATIIAAGSATPAGGAALLLGTRPFQLIGRYSYSWYLWHWPVLMIAPAALGVEPSLGLNLALAAASLALAAGSYHLVENPVRNRPWVKAKARRGLAAGLALTVVTAGFALVAGRFTPAVATGDAVADTGIRLADEDGGAGAEARLRELITEAAGARLLPANLHPSPEAAVDDQPPVYRDRCHIDYVNVVADNPCAYGDPAGADEIFLLGDSHAAHWFPAVDQVARERGLKLLSRTKSACQAATVLVYNDVLKRPYRECAEWRDRVLTEIEQSRPKFVVLSSNGGDSGGLVSPGNEKLDQGPDRDQLWVNAWSATFDRITRAGAVPVLLLDTPWPDGSAPECVVTRPDRVDRCARPASEAFVEPARREMVAASAAAEGVTVVDTRPWFCTDQVCPAVVGNLLVWKDNSHLTTAYARMLAPLLAAHLPR